MTQVIIVKSMNVTPEDEVQHRISRLGRGWNVITASTTVVPWGEMNSEHEMKSAMHTYFVTTVVLEKPDPFEPMKVEDI